MILYVLYAPSAVGPRPAIARDVLRRATPPTVRPRATGAHKASSAILIGVTPREAPAVISFVVPAHDEEALLPRTLEAIRGSVTDLGEEHEVVVVDDDSSDGTSVVAKQNGARVVGVQCRQIPAARMRERARRVATFSYLSTLIPS